MSECSENIKQEYFYGLIDEVRVSDYAKSADEILQEYLKPVKAVPEPTRNSLIISSSEPRNVLSAVPVRLPLIVADSITPEVQGFIDDYQPDYIYTLGFDSGLENSYRILSQNVPDLFFPNATEAVFVKDTEKAKRASALAYYLGIPLVFSNGSPSYEYVNAEGMSVEGIEDFYVQAVKGRGENIDYIVLANAARPASLLAGRLAGLRKGLVVPVNYSEADSVLYRKETKNRLKEAVGKLGNSGMYLASLEYRRGEPLYMAIIDGVPLPTMLGWNQSGTWLVDIPESLFLYSDLYYSDVDENSVFDLAVGRMNGNLTPLSLQIERAFLPGDDRAVFAGLYRVPRIMDLKMMGSGVMQAFYANLLFRAAGFAVTNLVERRADHIIGPGYLADITGDFETCSEWAGLDPGGAAIFLCFYKAIMDTADYLMYSAIEFDWVGWIIGGREGEPEPFLPLEKASLACLDGVNVLGYFGAYSWDEEGGWLVPVFFEDENFKYWQVMLWPYFGSTGINEIDYSGFLYEDASLSFYSEIGTSVLEKGGQAVLTSGWLAEPYELYTSNSFFMNVVQGKSLGQSMLDTANVDPEKYFMAALQQTFFNCIFTDNIALCPTSVRELLYSRNYAKDRIQRLLLGDPAYRPVEKGISLPESRISIGPFFSFLAESDIDSEYNITGDRLKVANYDDYLFGGDGLGVPLFTREFTLPANASVNWVNVSFNWSLYEGLEYGGSNSSLNQTEIVLECVSEAGLSIGQELTGEEREALEECIQEGIRIDAEYPYPEERFWWGQDALLDGRGVVRVFVPAVIYLNESFSLVLENATVSVDYDTPVEVVITAGDITEGQNQSVSVELINTGGDAVGTLYVWVEGNESFGFSEYAEIGANSSKVLEFGFEPEVGDYTVTCVFDSEISVGPRRAYFSVEEFVPVSYWSAEPDEIECILTDSCEENVVVSNSENSTDSLEINVSVLGIENLVGVSDSALLLESGESGILGVGISPEWRTRSGEYGGGILLSASGHSVPEESLVNVSVTAVGPEVSLGKGFAPSSPLILWGKYVLPKTIRARIELKNTGELPVSGVLLEDDVPDGWRPRTRAFLYVKKRKSRKWVFVRPGNYEMTLAGDSIVFNVTLPEGLGKGDELLVNYYLDAENAEGGTYQTEAYAEAEGPYMIYSAATAGSLLNVRSSRPSRWLWFLFRRFL